MSESFDIVEIKSDKKRFLPLLLVGDESEEMIDRYLPQGNLYVGLSGEATVAVCVTLEIDPATVEVKNLAVDAGFRRRGVGRKMLEHIEGLNRGKTVVLGTGETPSTLRFYEGCGYRQSGRIPGFFTDNYPEPIIEEGVTLRDMLYLKKQC